jgi:hypothetical protein
MAICSGNRERPGHATSDVRVYAGIGDLIIRVDLQDEIDAEREQADGNRKHHEHNRHGDSFTGLQVGSFQVPREPRGPKPIGQVVTLANGDGDGQIQDRIGQGDGGRIGRGDKAPTRRFVGAERVMPRGELPQQPQARSDHHDAFPVHRDALQQATHRPSIRSWRVTTVSQSAHRNGGLRQNTSYRNVNRVVTGLGVPTWATDDSLGGKGYRLDRRVYFQALTVATPVWVP